MRIIDKNNTELNEGNIDLSKGYLKPHRVLKKHHAAVAEVEEVTKDVASLVYPLQGAEGIPVADFDGDLESAFGIESKTEVVTEYQAPVEAFDEYEDVLEYVEYTQSELDEREIESIKAYLSDTDYVGVRIAEGDKTIDDYKDIIDERKVQRERMQALSATVEKRKRGKKKVKEVS